MNFLFVKLFRLATVMAAVSVLSFLIMNLLPGDAALITAGTHESTEQLAQARKALGLDEPVIHQYFHWLGRIVRGDLGESLIHRNSVKQAIIDRLPITLELIAMSQLLALTIAVPLGILCAYRPGGLTDRIAGGAGFGLMSVPVFVMGLLLISIFSIQLKWLPATGFVPLSAGLWNNVRSMLLPASCIAIIEWVPLMRILRSDMIATLQENFILLARSRGLPTSYILFRHALRPSSLTLITVIGLQVGHMIGGTIIVETIFALPGVGRLLVGGIFGRDYPVVQGVILVITAGFVLINFGVDMLYALLDPRTRTETWRS